VVVVESPQVEEVLLRTLGAPVTQVQLAERVELIQVPYQIQGQVLVLFLVPERLETTETLVLEAVVVLMAVAVEELVPLRQTVLMVAQVDRLVQVAVVLIDMELPELVDQDIQTFLSYLPCLLMLECLVVKVVEVEEVMVHHQHKEVEVLQLQVFYLGLQWVMVLVAVVRQVVVELQMQMVQLVVMVVMVEEPQVFV
jgi:hypothetical protein